jgi:hypothetical protein
MMYGVTRWHHQHEHVTMEEVLGALLLDPLEKIIEERTLKLIAKVAELPSDNLTRRVVFCEAKPNPMTKAWACYKVTAADATKSCRDFFCNKWETLAQNKLHQQPSDGEPSEGAASLSRISQKDYFKATAGFAEDLRQLTSAFPYHLDMHYAKEVLFEDQQPTVAAAVPSIEVMEYIVDVPTASNEIEENHSFRMIVISNRTSPE